MTTTTDKPFLHIIKRLSNAEVIMIMLGVLIVWMGYLTADIQYNRSLSLANQQNLAVQNDEIANQTNQLQHVIEAQGNLSASARTALINQFQFAAKHGGFATNESIQQNQQELHQILTLHSGINLKLDKLLNATR